MRAALVYALSALLYCWGVATVAGVVFAVPAISDRLPTYVKRVPRPPECPDCGTATSQRLVKAE